MTKATGPDNSDAAVGADLIVNDPTIEQATTDDSISGSSEPTDDDPGR